MSDRAPYIDRWRDIRVITRVDEYDGEESIRVLATQLGLEVSRTDAVRIVDAWVEFLSARESPIREIDFVSRTPKRLFDALSGQSQLERLQIKWGDYDELEPLTGMSRLTELVLGGASSVKSLAPIAYLPALRKLGIESLKLVTDAYPLANLTSLTDIELGGDWASPRNAHLDSISFLERMPQLERLSLHTIIVDDLDYSPLLRLPNLRSVTVKKVRGMSPTIDELRAALPFP